MSTIIDSLLLYVFSTLGSISIFIAALLISSKYAIKPKIRIWAFTFYIGACIFLGTWATLMNTFDGYVQLVQQIFLFFINVRGIRNARRELRNPKRDPFEVIVPPDFWEDILDEDVDEMEHDY